MKWEYLSTLIDRNPRDSQPYIEVGSWFQRNGNLESAIRWLKEAPQWNTANPVPLMTYARALKQAGNLKEAKRQFQKVVDGKWAPGLLQYRAQAINELNSLNNVN